MRNFFLAVGVDFRIGIFALWACFEVAGAVVRSVGIRRVDFICGWGDG